MDQTSTAVTADPAPTLVPPKAPANASEPYWTLPLKITAGLIAILAFFLGSFRPQNSDLWLTLGTGQLLASGEYQFGVDPFSWASDGAYWANPSWLSSLAAYEIYTYLGPTSLTTLKAVLIVVLAGLLFAARSDDAPLLPSLELTALALLVASPRFFLQPLVISYILLAALMFILVRDGCLGGFASPDEARRGPIWRIPLLFLAWSNLDSFFILGLFAMAVAAVGLVVFSDTRKAAKHLGVVLGLSVIASILNPHLLANLTLPTDLAYIARGYLPDAWTAAGRAAAALDQGDPGFYPMVSPFSSTAITSGGFNNNIAGFAFYLLVLVNAASFLACGFVPGTRGVGARGLVCLSFGLLAGFQIRLVPFYAIVAGPISTLNFTDYARWARLRESLPPGGVKFAAWTTCIALLGLTLFAWPGWLHLAMSQFRDDAMFQSARRVDWECQPDPSLKQVAESLREAQKRGEIHNVYNFAPDVAHYCAYFAPEVKCGIDQRLALFDGKAPEYAALRNELWEQGAEFVQPADKRPRQPAARAWPNLLADWNVDALAISGFHRQASGKSVALAFMVWMMNQDPQMWKPAYADGQSIVFDYSAERKFPVDAQLSSWRHEAFGVRPEATWLPDNKPLALAPQQLSWFDKYTAGIGPVPLETTTGAFDMESFLRYSTAWQEPYFQAYQMLHILPSAGHAGMVPGNVLAVGAAQAAVIAEMILRRPMGSEPHWFRSLDYGPPSLPILAQRNLRQSLAKNPNIAATHFRLAQNIRGILKEEAWWARSHQLLSMRTQLRQIELAAELRNASLLAPNNFTYQLAMADFLASLSYLDVAVAYHREATEQLKFQVGLDAAQKKEVDDLIRRQKVWERELKLRMDDYELKAAGVSDMERVRLAVVKPYKFTDINDRIQEDSRGRGLVLEALKVLARINPATLNEHEKTERAFYLIRLNCFQGNVHEAAALLNKNAENLGKYRNQCRLWISAATAWYEYIDEDLAFLEDDWSAARRMPAVIELIVPAFEQLNRLTQMPLALRIYSANDVVSRFALANQIAFESTSNTNEIRTLRGIYALERGDVETARKHFERALQNEIPFPDQPIALRYRDLIDEAAK